MPMSWALMALILVRVHARPTEWLTVEELASHLAVEPRVLREEANAMWESGVLELRCDGPAGAISHCRAMRRAAEGAR
jgi:hypothetical protein